MLVPELFIIVAANELSTGLVVSHLLRGALELRYIVEEIEREEDHGGDDPLECKNGKQDILVPMLSSDLFEQGLDFVLLLLYHSLGVIHLYKDKLTQLVDIQRFKIYIQG